MTDKLLLTEKIYLLSINKDKGGHNSYVSSYLPDLITASLFIDLYLQGMITLSGDKLLIEDVNTKSNLLKYTLEQIEKSKEKLLTNSIKSLKISPAQFTKRLQKRLVVKGLIRLESKSFLFFNWQVPHILREKRINEILNEIDFIIDKTPFTKENYLYLTLLSTKAVIKRIYPNKSLQKNKRAEILSLLYETYPKYIDEDMINFREKIQAQLKNV